ncbi:MAG: endolytic transglycosylase MltG [Saprospiraceae bacterium]|nr:endolytic transglycosylase MltG [Saprospiraceae bacterium]
MLDQSNAITSNLHVRKRMTIQKSTRRIILLVFLIASFVGAYLAWQPIKGMFFQAVPNELNDTFVCIPTGASFEEVVSILKKGKFIRDEVNFRWLAEQMNYKKDKMRAGRFEVKPGWTNRQLIQHLRSGAQTPVKLVLNTERLPEEVAGKAARFIEADSLSILQLFRDQQFLKQYNLNDATLMSIFIPNTYELFWNTDAKAFFARMAKEHDAFWAKDERQQKAANLGLNEAQVYTLASIVERETNANSEKPTIAGVYLNRLRIDMKLQADPTCVFATRDFATRRVTQYHTTFDSPYNTYMYKGLPPGPISMASIPRLDAVLNREKHNYLYFCAKPDDSGTHAFAETFAAHKVNADRFQAYVKLRGK